MDPYEKVIYRLETRGFAQKQDISDDSIKQIVEAGRLAPSAMNKQPWKFKVKTKKEELILLGKINP